MRRLHGIAWLLLPLLAGSCTPAPRGPERIILIVVDTLRRDHLSPYGSQLDTPNIQRLADSGQVFTNLQASYHQTTMSMAAMFTGETPSVESGDLAESLRWTGRHWCGMVRFSAGPGDSCLPRGLETLAERLKRSGYWTIGVTSNRLLFAPYGYEQGFDVWREVGSDRTDAPRPLLMQARAGDRVRAAVDQLTRDLPDGPLFLYVHYMDVHDYEGFDSYAEAVVHEDAEIGALVDLLGSRGLLEDAVILLTADHGEILHEKHPGYLNRGHIGNPSFQPVLEVPLIVSPARFEAPDRFMRGQDLPRLIEHLAGLEPRPQPTPQLAADELFLSERMFLTYRKGRFKSTFHRTKMNKWALYDLEADPSETRNIILDERALGVEHFERTRELAGSVAASFADSEEMTEEDAARLRALGYLE